MKIIKNEIKKIFNPTNTIIAIISSVIIWVLFVSFHIDTFPNGQPDTQMYDVGRYMVENFETEVDKNEMNEIKKLRDEKIKEADKYFSSREEFVKEGISSYEDFSNIYETNPRPENQVKLEEIHSKVIFEENVYLIWELDAYDYIIDRYENKGIWVGRNYEKLYKEVDDRYDELEKASSANSPLPYNVLRNYHELIQWVSLITIISIVILISPTFIRDNKNGVNYIQYSSKKGRNVFKKKLISGLISTFIIITIQLVIFFLIYAKNQSYIFWDCSINSFFSDMQSWYDITFGDYIILTTIMVYVIGIFTSVVAMFISSRVSSYMSLVGFNVISIGAIYGLIIALALNHLTTMWFPKHTATVLLVVLTLVSIVLSILMIIREKKLNIQ